MLAEGHLWRTCTWNGGTSRPIRREVPFSTALAFRPLGKNRPRPLCAPRVNIWIVCSGPYKGHVSPNFSLHVRRLWR